MNSELAERLGDDPAARTGLDSLGVSAGTTLAQVLKRPEVQIEQLAPVLRVLMPGFFFREEAGSCQPPAASGEQVVSGQWPVAREEVSSFEFRVSGKKGAGQLETENSKPETDFRLPAEIRNELKAIETEIKYSGYLEQQTKSIERLKKSEQRSIPDWFDYGKVSGLSREMNEKLSRVRPRTLGQASRIPGVTPAAVSLVNVYIEIQARQQARAQTAL